MPVTRDIQKEQQAVGTYQGIYKKMPDLENPTDRANLYKLAYSPAAGGLPAELAGTVDESLYSAGIGGGGPTAPKTLDQLRQGVTDAETNMDKTSQPNEALRVLQEAVRAKSGGIRQPLGESDIFKQAGLEGANVLSQSIATQNDKFTSDYTKFSNTIKEASGRYKDLASAALQRYDNAFNLWKVTADKLEREEADTVAHGRAMERIQEQARLAKENDIYNNKFKAGMEGFDTTNEGIPYKKPSYNIEQFSNEPIAETPDWMRILIQQEARDKGVPASLISSIINQESGFNPDAENVSDKERSYGLGQINLNAHPQITEQQAKDPGFAIKFIADRLKGMIDKYGVYEGVQAYNTPGAIGSNQLIKYADNIFAKADPTGSISGDNGLAEGASIQDPTSNSIMAATGLSNWAFILATQGTQGLTRLSGEMKTEIGNEWKAYQVKHGVDGATFKAQYDAYTKTVGANLLRNNQAKVAEEELAATVENIKEASKDADFGDLRWGNIVKYFAKGEINDPAMETYYFHLEQLRTEFALYNAALSGQLDDNGNVRDINKDDQDRAANVIKNGFAEGSIEGFETALNASLSKMKVVLGDSIENQNKSVWDLFKVEKPADAVDPVTDAQEGNKTINVGGETYEVGEIITNQAGEKARIEADGTVTPL